MEPEQYTQFNDEYIYGYAQSAGLEWSEPPDHPDWLISGHESNSLCALCALPLCSCMHGSVSVATTSYDETHQYCPPASSVIGQSGSALSSDPWPSWETFDGVALQHNNHTAALGSEPSSISQECTPDGLFAYNPQLSDIEADITSRGSTVCEKCSMTFRGRYQRGNLKRHIRHKHAAPALKCEVPGCFKDFARRDKLRDHVRNAHKGDVNVDDSGRLVFEGCESPTRGALSGSVYSCPEPSCFKSFNRNCELVRHQKSHLSRSERPHQCSFCQEGFIYPKDLERHRRKHLGTKETTVYYCPVPGCSHVEGFSRRDNLLRHQRKQHPPTEQTSV